MKNDTTVMEIKTGGRGVLRVWQSKESGWCWATPNGSEGSGEPSIDVAARNAHDAEGLLFGWYQLIELFQNEPEVHLDIEIDPGTHSQAFRLHNGQDGEGWQEFYSGTLDTTLENHKGGVIYADEVAAGLLSISGGFREDLASITEYKNLAAGIKA
jgi:hypothetical protein